MNLSNITIKAAEVIQQSQQLAFNHANANIETEHLLKALLDQQDSPVEYLLKKNVIKIDRKSELSSDDVVAVIRQQPNFKTLGMKIKLMAFNAVDSVKVSEKRIRKNLDLRKKNTQLLAKEKRINEKRIAKAKRKGSDWYTQKFIPLKDTIEPKKFFREWLKYKYGERPVILDTSLYNKSIDQLNVFLKKKGYYYGNVSGSIIYKNNRKAVVNYEINSGKRYYIDSVYTIGKNPTVISIYNNLIKDRDIESLENQPFDSDLLSDYRYEIAGLMRDNAMYGFSFSNVDYIVDTMGGDFKVAIGINFSDRLLKSTEYADSLVRIPHKITYVKNAYFHVIDTMFIEGDFASTMNQLNLPRLTDGYFSTKDTMTFEQVYLNRDEKKKRGIDPDYDTLNINRIAIFYYNEEMFVKPGIMELQNYLELSCLLYKPV